MTEDIPTLVANAVDQSRREQGWLDPTQAAELREALEHTRANGDVLADELIHAHALLAAQQSVIDAARVRVKVIRDCRQFGSGSDGWYQRDRESDRAIAAAVARLDAVLGGGS